MKYSIDCSFRLFSGFSWAKSFGVTSPTDRHASGQLAIGKRKCVQYRYTSAGCVFFVVVLFSHTCINMYSPNGKMSIVLLSQIKRLFTPNKVFPYGINIKKNINELAPPSPNMVNGNNSTADSFSDVTNGSNINAANLNGTSAVPRGYLQTCLLLNMLNTNVFLIFINILVFHHKYCEFFNYLETFWIFRIV